MNNTVTIDPPWSVDGFYLTLQGFGTPGAAITYPIRLERIFRM